MKNFTNNFKQFTSRLSARWLIMALMMLVGTSSAWAVKLSKDVYLYDGNGDYAACDNKGVYMYVWNGDWNTTFTLTKMGNNVFRYTANNYDFAGYKFHFGDWCNQVDYDMTHDLQTDNTNCYYKKDNAWGFPPVWTYTITNNGTTTYGGSGTSSSPYHVKAGTVYVKQNTIGKASFVGVGYQWKSTGNWTSTTKDKSTDSFTITAGSTVTVESKAYSEYSSSFCSVACTSNSLYFKADAYDLEAIANNSAYGKVQINSGTAGSSASATAYGSVSFKATVNTGYEFVQWNTKQDGTGTKVSTNATYTFTANSNVTYYAIFKQSCITPTISNITIDNASICAGSNAIITVTATNATSYQLYTVSGDNYTKSGSAQASNVFTVSTAGTYAVKALNGTCESSYSTTKTLSIINPSISNITISNNGAICEGSNATITVTATNATTYQLYTVSGDTYTKSGDPQVSNQFTVRSSGTYAVKALNGTCESGYSSTKTLTVNDRPAAPTFDAIPAQCGSYTLPTEDKNKVKVNWYNANGNEITSVTQSGTYYAEAVDGTCVSENRTDVEITINTKPTISISGSEDAVLYEDVTLTATATEGATVKWYEGGVEVEKGEGLTYVVTSETATSKAVTAKAFLNGCESATTKTVIFSAEDCNSTTTTEQQTVGKTKIIVDNPQNWSTMKCYAWRTSDNKKILGDWSGTNMNKNGNNYEIVIDFAEKGISESDKIQVIFNDGSSQTVDSDEVSCNKIYRFSIGSKSGDKYSFTSQAADIDPYTEPVEITVDPEITAPAAKTISVSTTDGGGNIIFSGQVVKTGCADALTYGFAYSTDANADKNNWTKVECANTGNTAGTQYNGEKTGIEVDGAYYVCAYITNSAGTTYGAVTEITVSTEKEPITTVILTHVRNQAGESYSDQELENLTYCVGDIVWFKLEQNGSNFQYYEWISYPGTELTGMYDGGMFKLKITKSGNVGIRLRNDANVDGEGNPTWAESNLLEFNTHPEPTAPYISIDPASGVLCEGYTATITVTNPSTDCAYKLIEEGSKAGFTDYESGDLTYTVGSVGKYYVAAQHIACRANEYTSNQVEINQIISTSASISIDPANPETTPWEPVTITVNPQEGYVYELSYTDNNLAGVDGVIIKQNGDSYTYYIPRPNSWGTGNSNSRTTIGYGIKATLKVEGEATQCQMSEDTATITLKDEDNEDCN